MIYFVFEMQKMSEQQLVIPTPLSTYSDWNQAQSEFHRLCSLAAVSSVMKHTVVMMDDNGFICDSKSYEHESE